ncbi:MAG: hypothetical protein WBK91_05195 [Alphaproteobacteria bacterium]
MVEDEPDHIMTLEDRLSSKGIPFLSRGDFRQARAILESGQKISMVLSDGRYPGEGEFSQIGSISLLRYMHMNNMMEQTPLIIMTNSPELVNGGIEQLMVMPGMQNLRIPEIVLKTDMNHVFAVVSRKLGLPVDPRQAGASRARGMCLSDL